MLTCSGAHFCEYLLVVMIKCRLLNFIQGSLSDRVGKKWFLVIGCLIGVIGSCISGSAQTLSTIVGGNVLTGIANAGCVRVGLHIQIEKLDVF